MITDPISDMLTRIRNSLAVGKPTVILPCSRLKFELAQLLEKEAWVNGVEKVRRAGNNYDEIKIDLKYNKNKKPTISSLKRVSTPGCRVYVNKNKLPWVLNDLGIAIISTSQGIMTNKEARKRKLGGEVLCEIW